MSPLNQRLRLPVEAADMLYRNSVRKRDSKSHKAQFGNVVVFGGGRGLEGAAIMAGQAALRVGCGYTSWVLPQGSRDFLLEAPHCLRFDMNSSKLREMVHSKSKKAFVIGCGLGRDDREFAKAAIQLATKNSVASVLDAGVFYKALLPELRKAGKKCDLVLTPHLGELSRMIESRSASVINAIELADRTSSTVILKGDPTYVIFSLAGDCKIIETSWANAALAKSGTGDILAGIIGSLLAQGLSGPRAALIGLAIHGRSAVNWSQHDNKSLDSLLPEELIAELPQTLAKMARSGRQSSI